MRSLTTAIALAALATVASAQLTGRVFNYTADAPIDTDHSLSGAPVLNFSAQITVTPYLYVSGVFGNQWSVDGPGVGTDTQTQIITIFHNETLNLDFEGFGDAAKVSGSNTGTQSIPVTASVSFFNHVDNTLLTAFPAAPATDLNSFFSAASPTFGALASGGALRIELTRELSPDAGVGPGVYEAGGTVTIVRS